MKALILLVQLILLAVTLLLARTVAPAFPLFRGLVVGVAGMPLSHFEFRTVLIVFMAFHIFLYLISLGFNRDVLFSSLRRTLNELYFVILGTTLSTCCLFLLTDVSFDVNFFVYAYVFNIVLYVLFFLVAAYTRRSPSDSRLGWIRDIPFITSIKEFVFCRWALLTGLVVLAMGFVGMYYKQDEDFRNTVNYLRVSLNVGSESSWELKDAYSGQSFDQPIDLRFSARNKTESYVLERPGRLYRVSTKPQWGKDLMLDITQTVGETRVENGALSFALHPEFGNEKSANSGFGYVYYTHTRPGMQRNRLSRFDLSLSSLSERVKSEVILIDQGRNTNGFHNGGSVLFGPDHFLYLSIGNLGDTRNNQRVNGRLAAGIIRIDVDQRGDGVSRLIRRQPLDGKTGHYYIPLDNPFSDVEEILGEFWALGFRNPFRMSLDRKNGEVWVGDVGGELYEEINKVAKGSNGQASYKEGPVLTDQPKPQTLWGNELGPIYSYRQTALKRAVIGGIIYRGNKYPELYGQYVFADNQAGLVWSLDPEKSGSEPRFLARTDQLGQNGITSLNETPDGDIYITVLGSKQSKTGRILSLEKTSLRSLALDERQVRQEASYAGVSSKYDMLCSRCHGLDGEGTTSLSFDRKPADFRLGEWQSRVSDKQIKDVIIKGGAALGLSRDMPSWGGAFSEAELELMVKKIRSFAKPDTVQRQR
jgi:glucose/arabinose dehydrogenase